MIRFYNNLKITWKLYTAFIIILMLLLISSAFSMFALHNVENQLSNLIEGMLRREILANEVGMYFSKSEQIANKILIPNTNDLKEYKENYTILTQNLDNIDTSLNEIMNSLNENKIGLDQSTLQQRIQMVENVRKIILVDFRGLLKQVYQNSTVSGKITPSSQKVISKTQEIVESAWQALGTYIGQTKEAAQQEKENIHQDTSRLIFTNLFFTLIIILSASVISFLIAALIRKPIIRLTELVHRVANGDLSVNCSINQTDEVGLLYSNIGQLINTVNGLLRDIDKTYVQFLEGDIDATIDESKYVGEYKKVAESINHTYAELINDTKQVVVCVDAYAKGNFDETIQRFKGKKAHIHESVDILQTNLKLVTSEIQNVIRFITEGDFSNRLQSNKYSGDWKEICDNLNILIDRVEMPIEDVVKVLDAVSEARFDYKVTNTYQGKFDVIKQAANRTVDNTSDYINDISAILLKMADQDFNIEINREYIGKFNTIKHALIKIIDKFNNVLNEFYISAEQVADGALQVSNSSMDLAQGATLQASAVEELNATIYDVANKTEENAANAKSAEQYSKETQRVSSVGKDEMDKMLLSMNEIEEASDNISKIIKVIEDISFQTNLLALNAAVEAARAGNQGKGFAVVAEEVRSLAGRSQKAAAETTALINRTVEIVANGTKNAQSTAEYLNQIMSEVAEVAQLIEKVSAASYEQKSALDQMKIGIQQISEVTQKNTAASEECASASQELSSQSETFKNALTEFQLKK